MLFIKIFVLCLVIEEDNAEARDKTSGSCSGKVIFDILKLLRNSVKNVLRTSGSSDFDTSGGQEIGFFSFTFPTNLLAQPFIRVSSVITMLGASTFVINYFQFVLFVQCMKRTTISILMD